MQLTLTCTHPPHALGPVKIHLVGSIDLASSDQLIVTARDMLAKHQHLIIDASRVDFIDCVGVEAFAEISRAAARQGCAFTLGPRSYALQHVLDVLGIGDAWTLPPAVRT